MSIFFKCFPWSLIKNFKRSHYLKVHMETHDPHRKHPYPCQYGGCDGRFARRVDLNRHVQSVSSYQSHAEQKRFNANNRAFGPMYLRQASDWTDLATDLYNTLKGSNGKRQTSNDFDPSVTGQNTDMAISAIRCSDYLASNPNAQADVFENIWDSFRDISLYGGLGNTGNADACATWKVRSNERPPLPFNVETKTGIQFVNTRYDPVTPLGAAQDSMKSFAKSGLIISDEAGHCSGQQGGAVDLANLMKAYFDTGKVVGDQPGQPRELCTEAPVLFQFQPAVRLVQKYSYFSPVFNILTLRLHCINVS